MPGLHDRQDREAGGGAEACPRTGTGGGVTLRRYEHSWAVTHGLCGALLDAEAECDKPAGHLRRDPEDWHRTHGPYGTVTVLYNDDGVVLSRRERTAAVAGDGGGRSARVAAAQRRLAEAQERLQRVTAEVAVARVALVQAQQS